MEIINENKEAIMVAVAAVIEVLLRLLPTKKNFSILHNVLKLIDVLIPNRYKHTDGVKVEKGKFTVTKVEDNK